MEYIRLLHLKHYDRNRKRFAELAFKNSSAAHGGGISVVHPICACQPVTGACLCNHIAQYYATVAGEPCAYWTFDDARLPEHNIEEVPSHTGDVCHRNIRGVGSGRAKTIFDANQSAASLKLCVGGVAEAFTPDRAETLYLEHIEPH